MSGRDFQRGRPPGINQPSGNCNQTPPLTTQPVATLAAARVGPLVPAAPHQGTAQGQGGYDWSKYDPNNKATWKRVYDSGKWVGYEHPSSNLGRTTYGPWTVYTGPQQPRTQLTPAEIAQVKTMTDNQFLSSPLYCKHYWRILDHRYVYAGDRIIGHQYKRSQH